MRGTVDPDVATLLEDLLARMRATLGQRLVGVYLFGSLVAGDFDRDISDLDLVAATASDLDDGKLRALARMHGDFVGEHPMWEDRLDIAYVSVATLRAFGTGASTIAVISPGEPFHRKEADRGWLMNWYFVRTQGITLFGPPPATIIRPISKDEFITAVRGNVRNWSTWVYQMRTRKAQAYVILTMCRALHLHETGEHVSKRRAAVWAERELPHWSPLIRDARVWRTAWRDEEIDHDATFPETLRFVQFMIQRIAGA